MNLGQITFISAGAGSGKTHRLTEILHRELQSGDIHPKGVIATTFTRKAAAELRERVRGYLLEQGQFRLANAMGQARIGTVNSVCGQLLDRFAFEAGLAPGQQVLEENQAAALLNLSLDLVLEGSAMGHFLGLCRRLGLDEAFAGAKRPWERDLLELVNQIRSNGVSSDRLAQMGRENARDLLSYFPAVTRPDLGRDLLAAIDEHWPVLSASANEAGKKNTRDYVTLLQRFRDDLKNGSATWSSWFKLAKTAPEARLRPQAEAISELAGQVAAHPALQQDLSDYLEQIFTLAGQILERYAQEKRERGVMDFTDQEYLLLGLLDKTEVREILSEEIELLLVDEFQDTSPIQLALFLKLAEMAGKVYWVGDIKQAIYGFRGSDTVLMQSVLAALPGLGGSKEVLKLSWRSRPELVRLVNALFVPAFSPEMNPDEVTLQAQRGIELKDAPLATWVLAGKNMEERASALAGGIGRLLRSAWSVLPKGQSEPRRVRAGDIAVLARSNAHVQSLVKALRSQGILCATRQPGLLQTPEAVLALACLRRLADPADTLASAEIVSLADTTRPEEWIMDRLRHLGSGGDPDRWLEADHPLLSRLVDLRGDLEVMTPREAISAVAAVCDLPTILIRWGREADRFRQRLANVQALMDLADQYEDNCRSWQQSASITGLLLWLKERERAEEDNLAEPGIDAVQVLTHHAAKGLEWPVVVLTDLDSEVKDRLWSISARPTGRFNALEPLADRFIRYWPWPFGAQRSVSLKDEIAQTPLAGDFRRQALEEAKRLLYVSMTRARDLLVLVHRDGRGGEEWLDTLNAPWLQSDEEGSSIPLPGGESVPCVCWRLEAQEMLPVPAGSSGPLYWFDPVAEPGNRQPLVFNPSAATGATAVVRETCLLGRRLPLSSEADPALLGTLIHAALAASFVRPMGCDRIERLLCDLDAGDWISADGLKHQIEAVHDWVFKRWPQAKALPEFPVQGLLPSGQVLQGRIDLLLDTTEGWILLDHKSTPLGAEHWDRLAREHGAQLQAYARAVEDATGRPVREIWLILPVAGGALKLGWEGEER